MLVICKQCSNEFEKSHTEIKKTKNNFCSRSCSAKFNNSATPKRKAKKKLCKKCNANLGYRTTKTVCSTCNPFLVDWNTITIQSLQGNAKYQKSAQIRDHARRIFRKSSEPKECKICGYDLHYDVCHIKPIHSFSNSATISEVNSLDNLVALCKNHHWELDNGYLKL